MGSTSEFKIQGFSEKFSEFANMVYTGRPRF